MTRREPPVMGGGGEHGFSRQPAAPFSARDFYREPEGPSGTRRFLAFVLALLLAVACLIAAAFPKENPMLRVAAAYQQEIAVSAGATYVSLRAINAALSVAQEVEVGGSLGVTANLQPLKFLDPVDDTVERISSAIFAVAVLTGVLSMSLAPVAQVGFVLLAFALVTRGGCEGAIGWHRTPGGLKRLSGVCGGLGFAFAIGLPLAYALGVWAGDLMTLESGEAARATLTHVGNEAQALLGLGEEERTAMEALRAYRDAAGLFWDQADDMLAAAVTLVGIFILRMVILPLVLLLALWAAARRLIG